MLLYESAVIDLQTSKAVFHSYLSSVKLTSYLAGEEQVSYQGGLASRASGISSRLSAVMDPSHSSPSTVRD